MKFLNLRESKKKQTDLTEDIQRIFWKKSGSKRKKGEFEIELEEEIKSLEEKITLLTEQSKKTLLRSKKQKKGIVMESMRIMKDQVKDWTLTRVGRAAGTYCWKNHLFSVSMVNLIYIKLKCVQISHLDGNP